MRVAYLTLLLATALAVSGCGVNRSHGYRVEIDGVLVLPETADPEQVTATLSYQHPRYRVASLLDGYQISGGNEPPWHKRSYYTIERELPIERGRIVVRMEDEVFRDVASSPRVLIEGEGIGRTDRLQVLFTHRVPRIGLHAIESVQFLEFEQMLPAAGDRPNLIHIDPSDLELQDDDQ